MLEKRKSRVVIGTKYGRLTVIEETEQRLYKCVVFKCRCDCGNVVYKPSCEIGRSVFSCGCLRKDKVTKHGKHGIRLYMLWKSMRSRCNVKSDDAYYKYGAIGLKVAPEWDDFNVFYEWSLSHGYNDNLSIDRIDNEKGYSPDNCRWVSRQIQDLNRRPYGKVKYRGVSINKRGYIHAHIWDLNIHKNVHLGTFKSVQEAAQAFNDYIDKHNLPTLKNVI